MEYNISTPSVPSSTSPFPRPLSNSPSLLCMWGKGRILLDSLSVVHDLELITQDRVTCQRVRAGRKLILSLSAAVDFL